MQLSALVPNCPLFPNPIPSSSSSCPTATATADPSFLLLLTVAKRLSCRTHNWQRCLSSNKQDSAFLSQDDEDNKDDDDTKLEQSVVSSGDDDDVISIDMLMDANNIAEIMDDNIAAEIKIEIVKTGNNCRRIQSEIGIDAPLNTVWNLLTDYERLADFIPGLAVCRLLHKTDNYARLFQIGEQNLAFGLKFNAKGIVDCYETPVESLPNFRQKRDIEFKMVEGDFEIFQGNWSLRQQLLDRESGIQMHTTLSYLVDVKPKLWLPVRLVEGRLCKEIKINLACIRQEALKITHNTLHSTP